MLNIILDKLQQAYIIYMQYYIHDGASIQYCVALPVATNGRHYTVTCFEYSHYL